MKVKLNLLVAALGLVVASGAAMAESQYGYSADGTGTVSARADLNVVVNVPKLLLLRVGASGGAPSTVNLNGAFTGIPGGVAVLNDGSFQASGWNDTAPVFSAATNSVAVRVWTNNSTGGAVSAAVVTPFSETGLDAKVAVGRTLDVGGGISHPWATLADPGTNPTTTFARNSVIGSNWTFSITAADLATLSAGSYTQVMRYTATSL